MATGISTRLALPYPVPGENVDVPRDVKALTDKLDPITSVFASGTVGARPASGTPGRFYFATDTTILYFDTGAAWVALNADPIPIGLVVPYTGTVAPNAKWLVCDGTPKAKATYQALADLCGTAFNTGGEAGTDFRLPDLRGRAVIGAGQGNPIAGVPMTNRTVGALDGEEKHALSIAEMPSHNHGGGDHHHTLPGETMLNTTGTHWAYATTSGASICVQNPWTNFVGQIITPQGGGGGHNNMPPSVTLGAIVKAL